MKLTSPTLVLASLSAASAHKVYREQAHKAHALRAAAEARDFYHPMAEHYMPRQAPAPASSAAGAPPPGASAPPAGASGAAPASQSFSFSLVASNPTAVPLASINSAAPSAPTNALASTPAAGQTPSGIDKAPPLPSISLSINNYPPMDKAPDTNSPQVQQWIQEVKNSGVQIPGFSPTVAGGCPSNPQAVADSSRCWWTCSGCVRSTDIDSCPEKNTWGLTYDDGPAPYTPDLLKFLDEKKLKSTFFVVGSRVLSFPDMLRYEYMSGHQISVHTWSHPALTTLSNEAIIAELGWTKQIIKDVLGVTPNSMRPPFGDIDDRVRAICKAMGLTPILWTRISATQTLDTDDFDIHGGLATVDHVLFNWQNIMGNVSSLNTGFIVLEHDLFQQTVEVATGYILPDALARGTFKIMPVTTCLNKPMMDSYIETNDNSTNPPAVSAASVGALSSGAPGSVQATGGAKNGAVGSVGMLRDVMLGAVVLVGAGVGGVVVGA